MMNLSGLPSISKLLNDPRLSSLPHALAKRAAQEVVAEARAVALDGGTIPDDLVAHAEARARLLQVGVVGTLLLCVIV